MFKKFLMIIGFSAAIAGTALAMGHGGKKDIVDIAAGDENFATLVAAVQAAELVETLKGDGPFTVFAPTNDAFAALPEGTVETLLKPENKDQLTAILTYHVVAGKVMSSDLSEGLEAETVNGQKITITLTAVPK
jgi:Secreted and surface protein containing fasciclin-like repeats